MSQTLAMTLLVRNEIDIVRDNIEFHLAHGVDWVVATDNGSVDGTREVLEEFERAGVLRLLDEKGTDYSQAKWVTRMATLARDVFGADWVLNNDADEFWVPKDGELKTELRSGGAPILRCGRQNMVFPHDLEPDHWREALIHRVVQPIRRRRQRRGLADPAKPLEHPLLYLPAPQKILCRTRGLTQILRGNHGARYGRWPVRTRTSKNIQIYHFPIRSQRQFTRKVREGGAACEEKADLAPSQSWHWRRWYRQMQDGDLDQAFREALPSSEQVRRDLAMGRLTVDRRFSSSSVQEFPRRLRE